MGPSPSEELGRVEGLAKALSPELECEPERLGPERLLNLDANERARLYLAEEDAYGPDSPGTGNP